MVKAENTRICVTMPKDLRAKIAMISFECQMSNSAIICMCLDEFVQAWEEGEEIGINESDH